MKLMVYSDLHLEFAHFTPPCSGADVIVLAGDIHTKARGVRWANETFDGQVVYVCGNHEFYGGHIDRTLQKMKAAVGPHVRVLENEAWVWNGTRFLGATTWTDFSSTGSTSVGMSVAASRMNDFQMIRADASYRRLRPLDVAARNTISHHWLARELDKPFDGRTVVVTHHAPVMSVIDGPRDHLTAAYTNHWPELVEKADLWIFGHTHRSVDMMVGRCRVVSNPRGYPGEKTGFNPGFEIEL
ncbi:metallophosphoesterase family protein [Pseudomonas putida]|uniref:metallophosphoesterase family protein n=1 Tax=Pseudomonas putida TaxID=303 RepID=UPI002119AF97|nr:metallophosphoesterase family protein [Pseudomonas putida]